MTSRTRFFILYNFATCALNFPIYINVDNDELDDDEKISEIRNTDLCEGVIPVIDIIQMLAGNPFIEIDFVNQENVMKILGSSFSEKEVFFVFCPGRKYDLA